MRWVMALLLVSGAPAASAVHVAQEDPAHFRIADHVLGLVPAPEPRERRGPYICISAINPDDTQAIHEKLRAAQIHVSLRGTSLRIAPYIYNTQDEVSRFIDMLKS